MRGRPGGRIGANVYPTNGKAEGLWWLGDVYLGKRFGTWPIDLSVNTGPRVAPAVNTSPTAHITFTQVKVDGGTLA